MAEMALGGALKVRSDLVFEPVPMGWYALAAFLALLFLVFQYRRLRRTATAPVFWFLMGTRVVLCAALLLLLMRPSILRQRLASVGGRAAVLLDTSRSMSLPYDGSESRLDAARKILARLTREGKVFPGGVEQFAFDETARPITLSEVAKLTASGRRTDLLGAVSRARSQMPPDAPLLVLTDGRQNAETAAAKASPVVFVGIGSREALRDLRVADLKVADVGFQGKPVEVTARIGSTGQAAGTFPVSFKVDGRLVSVQDVSLPQDGTKDVTFSWTPRETGTFRVSVEAKAAAGESVTDNNSRESLVRVARDRIRILFVAGSPSWNYRFLREALKRDPSLDLISFIILRSPNDIVDVPQNELSLIPFPTQKLFTQELGTFDLVIFDDFPYKLYMQNDYLDNLRKRVKEGGAFWMWGGPLTFVNGEYRGTAIEDLLPFSLEGPRPGEGYLQQSFKLRVTPAAGAGPLFGSDDLAPGREKMWGEMPALSGFNIVGPAKEGAVILADHPGFLVQGKPAPIIAMRPYGKGRVMAVATDYLWSWDFEAAGAGIGNRVFLEFIKNSVRWLTGDPFLSPVRLTVSPENAAAGDTVTARTRVLDANYRPVSNASLDLTVLTPQGERANLRPVPTGEEGIYTADFVIPKEGSYRFRVEAAGPGGRLGEATVVLSATGFQDEMAMPSLDEEYLRKEAGAVGGTYLRYAEEDRFYRELTGAMEPKDEEMRLVSEERTGLGSLPAVFLVFISVLTADWAVRKRHRLE